MYSTRALHVVDGKGDFSIASVLHHVAGRCFANCSHIKATVTSSCSEEKNAVLGMVCLPLLLMPEFRRNFGGSVSSGNFFFESVPFCFIPPKSSPTIFFTENITFNQTKGNTSEKSSFRTLRLAPTEFDQILGIVPCEIPAGNACTEIISRCAPCHHW